MSRKERNCPKEEVLLFVDGALEGEEQANLEVHLKDCSKCREYLKFVRGLKQAMKNLPEPEKEPCPSTLALSLYASGDLDKETAAHVGAHVLHCDECFSEVLLLEKMEETLAEEVEVPSLREPLYELVVKFAKGIFEIVAATGELFGGAQLQPAVVPVRAVHGTLYRDFVRMSQKINEDLHMEVRFSGSYGEGKTQISIFIHRITDAGIKEGVEDIRLELRTAKGKRLISKVTPRSGIVELGQWPQGEFVIGIRTGKGKMCNLRLELLPLDAERGTP